MAPHNLMEGTDHLVGLAVRDRGIGVEPDQAQRIFHLFQRAVGREVHGTGAGLAIVQQIAHRHGGRTWVQPREGGGSEFVLLFGTHSTIEATAASRIRHTTGRTGERVDRSDARVGLTSLTAYRPDRHAEYTPMTCSFDIR